MSRVRVADGSPNNLVNASILARMLAFMGLFHYVEIVLGHKLEVCGPHVTHQGAISKENRYSAIKRNYIELGGFWENG